MVEFRDYNLLDLIEETQKQAEIGTARDYLAWFSPEIRFEIITNFNEVSINQLDENRKQVLYQNT